MELVIRVEFGNEAMQTLRDANTAVFNAINRRSGLDDPAEAGDRGKIADQNGNTVGQWEVTE